MLSAIVAVTNNGVIGNSGEMPWYLPADLQHFKEVTMGHTVIMGRKTYQSIVSRLGHSLPGRRNIVITHSEDFVTLDAEVVHSLEEALQLVEDSDAIIIGGGQIYELAAPFVDRWYVTEIDTDLWGDVSLKGFDKSDFKEIDRQDYPPDSKNPFNYSFVVYERV